VKKTKSEDITDDCLGGNAEDSHADLTDLKNKLGGLPTTEQLALIAAALTRNTNDTPDNLTKTAMALWLSAREKIFLTNLTDEIWTQSCQLKSQEEAYHDFMKEDRHFFPGEEPITRDVFLRTMLPKYKNRADKLAQIAKAFVRDTLRELGGIEPSQEEVNVAYGKWKPYENAAHANGIAKRFEQWHELLVKRARSAAGMKSAAKKAALKKSRRPV
jgi:hypothetical protein